MKIENVTPIKLGFVLVLALWATSLSVYGFAPEPMALELFDEKSMIRPLGALVFPICGTLVFLVLAVLTKIWPRAFQVRKPQKGLRRALRSESEYG